LSSFDAALVTDADADSVATDYARPHVGHARHSRLVVAGLLVVVVVVCALPFSRIDIGGSSTFVPAIFPLAWGLDLLCAALLIRHFRDSGDARVLLVASAYVFSLVVLGGSAAAFPGAGSDVPLLGAWPSTAPWLWVAWHTGFPVLLAAGVAPWPDRWSRFVSVSARRRTTWAMVVAAGGAGTLMVVAAANGRGWLPVVIDGVDMSALTRATGPVILPVVLCASVVTTLGAIKLSGPMRWAALASAATLGDVVLTLYSLHRYSLGWYVGRGLTIVSCAVVLVAILAEFGRLKLRLEREATRLRLTLARTEDLQEVQSTLLSHMTDGVLLQGADGHVVAMNPAAQVLLGLSADQLLGRAAVHPDWMVLRSDGTVWPIAETPALVTLSTGIAQHDQMVGVLLPGGERRWLRVNTSAKRTRNTGEIQHVVTSMTDETRRHNAQLALSLDRDTRRRHIQAVLDHGGPQILVQPIVDLATGAVVGGEALSRFAGSPAQGPDRWFADALDVGFGSELELTVIRLALAKLKAMPKSAYLSINMSPSTASSTAFIDLLGCSDVALDRVVIELTEHSDVSDYAVLRIALANLRGMGVRIAIDDTGAGFASLSHVLKLRPDIVKLDIDLIRGIHNDPARRSLVSGLVSFAKEIGTQLLAEGIETADELSTLRQIGVMYGQGYYLGTPALLPLPLSVPVYTRKH
jgi:PAS domain S-box-containing protein